MLFIGFALAAGLHLVEVSPATQVWLAVSAGTVAGLVVAVVAWWTRRPLTISPAWELTGRVFVWALLAALAVWVAVFVSPLTGGFAVAAVVGAGVPSLGPHLAGAARRMPRLRWARSGTEVSW
jgi:hypothetical protein